MSLVAPLALVGGAVTVLVLGAIGLRHLPWDDFLIREIQLLTAPSNDLPPQATGVARVARVLGALLLGFGAVLAALVLFWRQLQLLLVRLHWRRHVIVAGLGEIGSRLVFALDAADYKVVAIERDASNPQIRGCWARRIPVIVGDAADGDILVRARPHRAARLVVTCGRDALNVDVARAAAELRAGAAQPLRAGIQVDDPDLWRLLGAEALHTDRRSPVRMEFFSVFRTAAAGMLSAHPPGDRVIVVGAAGPLGLAVSTEIARLAARDGVRRTLMLAGPGAADAGARLVARWPGIAAACELECRDGDPVAAVAELPGAAGAQTVYVCIEDESESVAAALHLAARDDPLPRDVSIVVAVRDAASGVAHAVAVAGRGRTLHAFGVLERSVTTALVLDADTELLARAAHEGYVLAERAAGRTAADNASVVPWDELPESLRESNRRFAQSIGDKLRGAGCNVVPAGLTDGAGDGAAFRFSDADVEQLAFEEHNRWMEDLHRDGWRRTSGEKDPERRRHPKFVPWPELSEEEREKDRRPIRELPAMLDRLGYRIDRGAPSD